MAKMNFVKSNETFINPYNFVNVNWQSTPRKKVSEKVSEESLTGVLHCKLRTRTPLAIPDFIEKKKDHSYYGIMKDADGKVMIPGSSIRGPIRSVYETVTESCFSTSKDHQIITKRVTTRESGQAGVIKREEDGTWKLYEANRHLIVMDDDRYRKFTNKKFSAAKKYTRDDLYKLGEGTVVYFDTIGLYSSLKKDKYIPVGEIIEELSKDDNGQKHHGYLCIGEVPPLDEKGNPQTNKHFESVFELRKQKEPVTIKEETISRIKYLLGLYNDQSVNRNATDGKKDIYGGLFGSIENGIIPIWFRHSNESFVFSLAAVGRISFETYLDDLLGSKKKCTEKKEVCEACGLFGMASSESIGSRIRFTDAKMDPDKKPRILEKKLLKELGSPKISYIPFYAEKNNEKEINNKKLDSYDDEYAVLKGRKYYWHNMNDEAYIESVSEANKRNATMDLLDADQVFSFDVFYEQVSEDELKKLKWVLTLGENNPQSAMCHKIGHGKPIGLGSVKITIDKDVRRSFDQKTGYTCIPQKDSDLKDLDLKHLDEIRIICNASILDGKRISYPYIVDAIPNDNNTAPHRWFSENWVPTRTLDQNLPTIKQVEDGEELYAYSTANGSDFEKDALYKGKVTGYNNNNIAYAKVELENSKSASFWDGNHIYDGREVLLKYLGKKEAKNGNLYDNWKLIKVF